jgi:hypothetical protein
MAEQKKEEPIPVLVSPSLKPRPLEIPERKTIPLDEETTLKGNLRG